MVLLYKILDFNKWFVEEKLYQPYVTSKIPNKKAVILTCMDTRLLDLLPKSMNLRNGDVKIVKNAGAIVEHPFDSTMRSLLVAIYELQAEEIFVIGHYDCGMENLNGEKTMEKMIARGVTTEAIETLHYSGISLRKWLKGFSSVEDQVRQSVYIIKHHPLLAKGVPVHGLVIDPKTGKLKLVIDGYAS